MTRTIIAGRLRNAMVASLAVMTCGMVAGDVQAAEPEGVAGPDVVVFEIPSTWNWGAAGGIRAYSVGTTSCNRGDVPLDWISWTNEHPVIAQNLYRVTLPTTTPTVEHGKIEMLGMSWLKHGFVSINQITSGCGTCEGNPPGQELGVGCTDPYGSYLNGTRDNLGPRSEVNAFTGYFPPGDPPRPDNSPSTLAISGRIQVPETEMISDASRYRYFVEGQYVAPDDAAADNALNNVSHREVVLSPSDLDLDTTGATQEGRPAIYAWRDIDPTVTINEVRVPREGLFVVAYKVSDNGDGTWHYEYSVFNLNSHISGRSFSVPILPNSVITNAEFRDVDHHSGEPFEGTDWTLNIDHGTGWMGWSTFDETTNPLANALRWSTMFSFRFDADSPPLAALATIGLYREGAGDSIPVMVQAPATNVFPLFTDGFEHGTTDEWSAVNP